MIRRQVTSAGVTASTQDAGERTLSMSCPKVVVRVLMCSCSCVRPHTMHAGLGGSGRIVVTSRGAFPRNASCEQNAAPNLLPAHQTAAAVRPPHMPDMQIGGCGD